jgi:hypothetical protein
VDKMPQLTACGSLEGQDDPMAHADLSMRGRSNLLFFLILLLAHMKALGDQ